MPLPKIYLQNFAIANTNTHTQSSSFNTGDEKHWDTEVKGLVLFVGKKSKTCYFQKDVGGQTKRTLFGRYPVISADVVLLGRGGQVIWTGSQPVPAQHFH